MQYLQTRVEVGPGNVTVVASGEVDLGTTSVLANAIADGFARGSRVIVDLSGLRHLDASGIRVLLGAARAYGSRLVVVVSNPAISRLFDILGLKGVVAIAPSLPAARDYLRNR
ncbi:MAG TPA: STAS domain-containing protein [bacterium]|nr:STAS domain-containing protein [bacterium]